MSGIQALNDSFIIEGKPVRILAGAMHYFRIPKGYWRDRMLKLKAAGFNALETYVAWNLHEPQPGRYDFADGLDLEEYLRMAGELGLYALVRPGPYICSEWEFGGLPWWLLADENIRLRCMDPIYIGHVDRWFGQLMPRLARLQWGKGGPVIAVQVENEYGSYGNDREYLMHIRDLIVNGGIDRALLYTSDGPSDWMLQGGTLPDVFKTANFGSRPGEAFAKLREYQKIGPLMCAEYWNGWFDHWGEAHHRRDSAEAAKTLDEMLAAGASVSFYMFTGGTNFGFMAGANDSGKYEPDVTSYDYDALLSESGDITPKYLACRDVIAKYAPIPAVKLLPQAPKKAYGTVSMTERAGFFENMGCIGGQHRSPCPYPMEKYGQGYGYILYRTEISGPREEAPLVLQDVHDRALVFLDGRYLGTVDRNGSTEPIAFAVPEGGAHLDVLVENMGRINYGTQLMDPKGITVGIRHGQQFLYGYKVHTLPMDDLSNLTFSSAVGTECACPAFYRGVLRVNEPGDTFLRLPGWGKGFVTVNGFNIGRYWQIGPQQTLYIPGTLLHTGDNEIIAFELHHAADEVEFLNHPILG